MKVKQSRFHHSKYKLALEDNILDEDNIVKDWFKRVLRNKYAEDDEWANSRQQKIPKYIFR